MDNFYENLTPFARFDEITDAQHFRTVPKDWVVILTDVKNSTVAIEDGRYKDVNTIGVAGIVSVANALGHLNFPFAFGGDGATILLPESMVATVSPNLLALAELSRAQFGLELRIGMVPVSRIVEAGKSIDVARLQIECGMSVAVIRGGGLNLAERWIKGDPETYALKITDDGRLNLKGLSCRWQEIPSENGSIVSLLVLTCGEAGHDETYREVLGRLREIVGDDLKEANPVHPQKMIMRSAEENRGNEARFEGRRSLVWLTRLFEMFFVELVFKIFKKPPILHDYKQSMRTHSDYRKFDDMLRMIIDCTPSQSMEIREMLEGFRRQGRLYFGLFETDASLMTCFFNSMKNEGHIHFIDGANGGYALAAKELKAQMGVG